MKHAHRHSRLSSTNAPSPSCSPQQSKVSKNLLDRSSPFAGCFGFPATASCPATATRSSRRYSILFTAVDPEAH
jgi:hypothetical protein